MSESIEIGVVDLTSAHNVEETVRRVVDTLEAHGMTIFARIDQRAAAVAAGLELAPMVLVLFGDPRTGTPLMRAYPSLAIDLPLKVLVWEDASSVVRVSTNSPEFLRRRHRMAETPFRAVGALLAEAIAERSV